MNPFIPLLSRCASPLALLAAVGMVSLLSSCSIWETDDWRGDQDSPENVFGMRPVYARSDAYDVYTDVVRAIENQIAVVEDGDRLYTVDADLGIHVIDNTVPASARQIAFIQVPGIRTASVSGDFIYANNFTDFITIDISDLSDVVVVDRQADFYDSPPASPPNFRGFFDCYDEARGPLLGWEEASLNRPQCRSNF